MRRFLTLAGLLIVLATPLFSGAAASAQFDPFDEACQGDANNSEVCNPDPTNPIAGEDGVLVTVLNILSFIVGVASVLMVILGGLKYITSNGDSTALSNAKNTILYAIIGLVVFLFSQIIIRFVISKL